MSLGMMMTRHTRLSILTEAYVIYTRYFPLVADSQAVLPQVLHTSVAVRNWFALPNEWRVSRGMLQHTTGSSKESVITALCH